MATVRKGIGCGTLAAAGLYGIFNIIAYSVNSASDLTTPTGRRYEYKKIGDASIRYEEGRSRFPVFFAGEENMMVYWEGGKKFVFYDIEGERDLDELTAKDFEQERPFTLEKIEVGGATYTRDMISDTGIGGKVGQLFARSEEIYARCLKKLWRDGHEFNSSIDLQIQHLKKSGQSLPK